MTTENQILQSIFPDVPRESPAIMRDGNFTFLWELYFGNISQALQANFKNEGIVFPPLSASNMAQIQALYTSYVGGTYNALTANLPDISGQTVFDSTTRTTNQFIIATDTASPRNVTLAEWVPMSYMLTYAGNPNTHLAGVLNWLCYDTTDKALYICTTAGNASSAVWQSI